MDGVCGHSGRHALCPAEEADNFECATAANHAWAVEEVERMCLSIKTAISRHANLIKVSTEHCRLLSVSNTIHHPAKCHRNAHNPRLGTLVLCMHVYTCVHACMHVCMCVCLCLIIMSVCSVYDIELVMQWIFSDTRYKHISIIRIC